MYQFKIIISAVFLILLSSQIISAHYVNLSHVRPWKVRYYPKKTLFRKADLIDKGCNILIRECPKIYKRSIICARHYDGNFKTFTNFCEMEYENCNSWRQWSMIKQERC